MNKDISSGHRETLISKHHLLRFVLSALFLIALASLFTSCSHSYFTTFSTRINELDFTFEYPRGWQTSDLWQYPDIVSTYIIGPDVPDVILPDGTIKKQAHVVLILNVFPGLAEKAEQEAQDKFNFLFSVANNQRNFILFKQDFINLDGYKGYQAVYSSTVSIIQPGGGPDYTEKMLVIEIPCNGRIYEIQIGASEDEWNNKEKDIQHILDTFKWK